ncbi:MAG: 16S rRNA (guanine(527)-N(7))-methyltransferase RsmG [Elusimicrobia bacterium]|nr:16S rRNA (guanine(527)-N(7))-methyltransferase RsmG [Elusimicrobiota bacterium]
MKEFLEKLDEWKVNLTKERLTVLECFARAVIEKNQKLNLISRKDIGNIWSRHILDSLAFAPATAGVLADLKDRLIIDAGSGGGFPGIPNGIFVNEAEFELWEASRKKHSFLTWITSSLKLKNIRAVCRRIEECRNAGDIILERAAGKLENILPQCLNILREDGFLFAWQSDVRIIRQESFKEILLKHKAEIKEIYNYTLPAETRERFIIIFKKNTKQIHGGAQQRR